MSGKRGRPRKTPEIVENQEEQKESVVSQAKPLPEVQERPTLTLVSDLDAYVSQRMKSGPKTLDEVLFVKEKQYAPGEHRLSLPQELRKYTDRFAFRWINKKKRAIDDAVNLKGWVLVNRALFPDLPDYLFSTTGGVEVGDTILGFMKKEKAEAIRRAPGEKSRQLLETNPMIRKNLEPLPSGKSGFYKPKPTKEDEE